MTWRARKRYGAIPIRLEAPLGPHAARWRHLHDQLVVSHPRPYNSFENAEPGDHYLRARLRTALMGLRGWALRAE